MKVLLDEDLPHNLRPLLTGHDVFTTQHMGWAGVKNGALLKLTQENGFEAFVTADQNLPFQQNLENRAFGIVVLSSNRWPAIEPHIESIADALKQTNSSSLIYVQL